eukprot:TRINITY_DN16560_c0_g1_i4.p1 TRINITY_DN16560_c0_g1~~TRINITY_DN16560_c0_g1_i4.p1  ORF type:complete len:325 (+),score=72.93 TRINITY_DN16560_c0_g1_i4:62-1036(+)
MVLSILGTVVDKCPESLDQLHQQFVHLRNGVSMLGRGMAHPVDSSRSLYVAANEFAVVYDMDSSVDIVGTDTIGSSVLIILRSRDSCSTLVCHASHITTSDMDMLISSMNTTTMLQMTIIGGYQSQHLVMPILATVISNSHLIELVALSFGPLTSGVGVNVKTGEIFSARFSDKGPDMDLRTARTLAGGQNVGLLNIYNSVMEELTIGPFTYSPMRAVDIWLAMTDQFLLQSLCPSPEAVEDPVQHVSVLRAALSLIKNHPYPAVTIFRHNRARCYRRDHCSGGWLASSTDQSYDYFLPCSAQYGQYMQEYQQWGYGQMQDVYY